MPVPSPREGESENNFISRCVSQVSHADPDRPNDQVVAMCYNKWRESKKGGILVPGEEVLPLVRVWPAAITPVKGKKKRYKAYAAIWGDEENPDLYGTFFNRDTNFHLDWFDKRPWLYHHGMNQFAGAAKVGEWKDADLDDYGMFFLGELDERFRYLAEVEFLMELGYLFPSSGTLSYLAKVADDGWVEEWPIVELSATVAPAEFRIPPVASALRSRAAQAIRAIQGGIVMPEEVEVIEEQPSDAVVEETPEPQGEPEPVVVERVAPLDDPDLRALFESFDDVVHAIHDRLTAIEGDLAQLMQPPAEQVRQLVEAGVWSQRLFSVSHRGAPIQDPPEGVEGPTTASILGQLGQVGTEPLTGNILGAIADSQRRS